MSSIRVPVRPSRGLRNIFVALITLALTAVGFVGTAPVAEAATKGTYKGRGEGSTKAFKLEGGSMYKFVVRYSGNGDSDWPENFVANLVGGSDAEYGFVDEYEVSNRVTRVVRITGTGKGSFWVDVDTDADASWIVSLKKVSKATEPGRSGTVWGDGSNVSGRYNLKAGVYTVRLSYSNNVDWWGDKTYFSMDLRGNDAWNDQDIVSWAYRKSGSVTRNVRCPSQWRVLVPLDRRQGCQLDGQVLSAEEEAQDLAAEDLGHRKGGQDPEGGPRHVDVRHEVQLPVVPRRRQDRGRHPRHLHGQEQLQGQQAQGQGDRQEVRVQHRDQDLQGDLDGQVAAGNTIRSTSEAGAAGRVARSGWA